MTHIAECTFIVLDRALPDTPGTGRHGGGERLTHMLHSQAAQ